MHFDNLRLTEIAYGLETLQERLEALKEQADESTAAALDAIAVLVPPLAERLREESRVRLGEGHRLEEVLDLLFSLAGLDFSKRASITSEGSVLDEVAATANMLSEELEATQNMLAERNRALEAATEAKSRFLASLSHEIRTPLGALLGFAELLCEPELDEATRIEYAKVLRSNGEHLHLLLDDLLDLSRIEAGRLKLEWIDCPLLELVQDLAALIQVRARAAGLDFALVLETALPVQIRSDPTRLRQILLNLLGNAVKFTPSGSVRLAVSFSDADQALCFRVSDTGIGMDPGEIERLFRPFEQVDPSMTRRFGGSGLGLAICRSLAEALGAELMAESQPGQGSTFQLRFWPEVAADTPRLRSLPAAAAPAPLQRADLLCGRILLAEDGSDNQLYLVTMLRKRGLEVETADNGRIALERALGAWRAGAPFGVILMDMQMPELDGYQATAALRAEGYPGPIVALTAHVLPGERERCLKAGCDDYLNKPITQQALIACVGSYLKPGQGLSTAEPPASPAGQPVCDATARAAASVQAEAKHERLYSSFSHDPDMTGLIARFVGQMPERIRQLESAADAGQLLRLAHQLKGAAGSYGFAPISAAAGALEDALKRTDGPAIPERLAALSALCARVGLDPKHQTESDTP